MVVIESAGISDVGKKRTGNEDAMYLDDELSLYVVADGMGGHQAGEVASGLVIETIRDYMRRVNEDADAEELEDSDETLSKPANQILSGIHLANRGVHEVSKTNEAYSGMGSTVSAVYFIDETLISANVGDSPIYLSHNGNIELLSVTHNVITEQAAIDPEAAKQISHQYRNLLTRAMGIKETVEPDVCEIQFFKGDSLVISSDGLSDKVSPEEIFDVVWRERPENACQMLVDMANDRGGDDNITVIVLKVKQVKEEKSTLMEVVSRILFPFKKIFN
ncbi:MAG: serine/threonine-protein phosphatase [Deltaproteobacteria bacterium]|nr:serine/threonine-protein phosphatase [Deltaproteobacteria bacterium]